MSLKGGRELKARLKTIRLAFKSLGRQWGEDVVSLARPRVPVKSGRLRKSIRLRNATQRRAVVVAHYTANFVDAGTKAHAIRAKKAPRLVFQAGGRTIFAKKVNHPRVAARPFKARAAHEALRRHPLARTLIDQWNRAA